jgi:N-acetylglucosamine-6-phosphate deacetylase
MTRPGPGRARTIRGREADGSAELLVTYSAAGIESIVRRPLTAGASLPVIAPGLIDAQVNGYLGLDVNDVSLTPDTVCELTERLARTGVTTWLPTIISASEERIGYALAQIAQARKMDTVVHAAIPSVHVEGPFISDHDGARGVHDPHAIRPLDAGEVARWQRHGPIGLVTVSPHTPDAAEQIARIRSLGPAVALGHTHATPEQVIRAVDAGASFSTHLGNGVPALLPRHPNLIWTQLAEDRLTAGFIADGHHLPMDTLEVMLRAKTTGRAFLVSDVTALGGCPPGRYQTAVGGAVQLDETNRLTQSGTGLLAGAASTLVDGLRNVVAGTTLTLARALPLVTATAARALAGARPGLGRLRESAPADLVLLDPDQPGGVVATCVVQSGRTLLS